MPLTITIRRVAISSEGEDDARESLQVAPARCEVVRAFALLDPEAFDFLVAQNMQIGHEAGGFRTEAREGLEQLSKASEDYFDKKQTQADRS